MSKIISNEKTISIDLDLLSLESGANPESDFETWLFFSLEVDLRNEIIGFSSKDEVTLSLFESRKFLNAIESSLENKRLSGKFSNVEFYALEDYFKLILSDVLEDDMIRVELWLNIGELTNGEIIGYEKGFKFDATLENVKNFHQDLSKKLDEITNTKPGKSSRGEK